MKVIEIITGSMILGAMVIALEFWAVYCTGGTEIVEVLKW